MDEIHNDPAATFDADTAARIDAYWRACNYLAAGMIYLRDNPLLRRAAAPGAHQAAPARALGREPRAQPSPGCT